MARVTPTGRGVALTHLEFDLLWADLGAGDPPYPLEVASHGATAADRDALGAAVFGSLHRAGLVDDGEVSGRLQEMLGLLAAHPVALDALVYGERALRVLVASDRRQALLAVLDDDELVLEPVRADRLVDALGSVVGDRPAGPGAQVRLPRVAYSAALTGYAQGGYAAFEKALSDAGLTGRALRALTTIVDSTRTGAGQAAATGPGGRSPVLSWVDTTAGRYTTTVEDVAGEQWVTVSPADWGALAWRLTAMLGATS